MKRRQKVGLTVAAVGFGVGDVALWLWAVNGMSQPVQAASAVSAGSLFLLGLLSASP